MLLRNPTQAELQHLRGLTGLPNAKVRHLVMSFLPDTRALLQVFAYAVDKQTVAAWRRILGHRMENIRPPPVSVVHSIHTCRGLRYNETTREFSRPIQAPHAEEYGVPSRSVHLEPPTTTKKRQEPTTTTVTTPRPFPLQSAVANQAFAMAMRDHVLLPYSLDASWDACI
jgi:hypothetical protein